MHPFLTPCNNQTSTQCPCDSVKTHLHKQDHGYNLGQTTFPHGHITARIQILVLQQLRYTPLQFRLGDLFQSTSMSFTNAPVTRGLVLGLVATSIAASLFDAKHYFYILVDPHILRYHQPWRALLYQLCYTNSSEVLFASMTLYNMRLVERMWGSRKYAVSLPWIRLRWACGARC